VIFRKKGEFGSMDIITQTKITCPVCGHVQEEEMPLDG
jgi:uncharacterized protein (DUF2225 family)